MSLRIIASTRQRVFALARPNSRAMGGHGGPTPPVPPFARNKAASGVLHQEHELVWDDGVAPELTLDFDAQHISKGTGLRWWLGGFGFFAGLMGLVWLSDPASKNPAVNRMANIIPDPLAQGNDKEEDE